MSGKKIALAAGVVVVGAVIAAAIYLFQARDAHQQADEFLQHTVAKMGTTRYDSAQRSLNGSLTIKHLTVTPAGGGKPYKIRELVVHRYDEQNAIPHFADIQAKGIEIDMTQAPDPRAQLFLAMMGYQSLSADMALDYEYKPKAKTVSLRVREAVKDMADFEVSMDLNNISIETAMFTYPLIEIKQLKMSYRDRSLINRIVKVAAAQAGTSEAVVVTKLKADIDNKIAQNTEPLRTMVLTQVKKLLDTRGSLTLSMTPHQPVRISDLQGIAPSQLAERLNINVYSD